MAHHTTLHQRHTKLHFYHNYIYARIHLSLSITINDRRILLYKRRGVFRKFPGHLFPRKCGSENFFWASLQIMLTTAGDAILPTLWLLYTTFVPSDPIGQRAIIWCIWSFTDELHVMQNHKNAFGVGKKNSILTKYNFPNN